jgi:hypothetical protein
MKNFLTGTVLLISLASCHKTRVDLGQKGHNASPQFTKYTIASGQQYCDQNDFKQTNYNELKFVVKFDSTAIYQTLSANNQNDINKLYGFSDNNADHHQFSARIGWRWSDGALRLFGYIYNNSIMSFEELGKIGIGEEHTCSIKITATQYIFTLNNVSKSMPRTSLTSTAIGYKLYPYFGGDESAPHTIYIWIKEL